MESLRGIPHGKHGYCWLELERVFLGQLLKVGIAECAAWKFGFTLRASNLERLGDVVH